MWFSILFPSILYIKTVETSKRWFLLQNPNFSGENYNIELSQLNQKAHNLDMLITEQNQAVSLLQPSKKHLSFERPTIQSTIFKEYIKET